MGPTSPTRCSFATRAPGSNSAVGRLQAASCVETSRGGARGSTPLLCSGSMKWTKSPEWLIQAFEHGLPMAPGVERRPMFGYPCAFVHRDVFCGVHQGDLIV